MKNEYSIKELKETFWSKLWRWFSFGLFSSFTLKSNDGRIIFVCPYLGIICDNKTLQTIKIKEFK